MPRIARMKRSRRADIALRDDQQYGVFDKNQKMDFDVILRGEQQRRLRETKPPDDRIKSCTVIEFRPSSIISFIHLNLRHVERVGVETSEGPGRRVRETGPCMQR